MKCRGDLPQYPALPNTSTPCWCARTQYPVGAKTTKSSVPWCCRLTWIASRRLSAARMRSSSGSKPTLSSGARSSTPPRTGPSERCSLPFLQTSKKLLESFTRRFRALICNFTAALSFPLRDEELQLWWATCSNLLIFRISSKHTYVSVFEAHWVSSQFPRVQH